MRRSSSSGTAVALLLLAILGCRSGTRTEAPSWTKAKKLATNEDHPSKLVSDGNFVYFVTGGTVASMEDGTNNIKKINLKDGSISILVKGGKLIPDQALAVDDKFLYWSDGGNLMRVPKEGGSSETIIPHAPKPDELLMDDENFYWLIWGGEGSPPLPVMSAPKKGGEVKQLTPPQEPSSGLAIDKDFVYWMTGSGIKKIAKTGGEITEVYHNPAKTPSLGLAMDADNFYFMQMNGKGHSALMKLGKKDGVLTQLAPSISHTMEFIIDDANVYYYDQVPNMGSFGPDALKRISKSGGGPVSLDQGDSAWGKYLTVDSKHIYFTDIANVYALAK
jgi:sugar lactone lactonase YvrE